MARYRLYPTATQAAAMVEACGQARAVWNAALEQRNYYWKVRRTPTPGFVAQCRQLSEARAEIDWLARGSVIIQQQALRDLDQAFRNFFQGTHRYPSWRRRGQDDGFRIVGVKPEHIRRLNRSKGAVYIPKIGWVRFRWSRDVPSGVASFRVTLDASGRWHVAFAVPPAPIPGPGTGQVVGLDFGVAVSVATSDGELLRCPALRPKEAERLLRLQRRLARAQRGSNRRHRIKLAIARLRARERDRRKNWIEQVTTDLARRYDVLKVEDLKITTMTASAMGTIEQPGRNVRQKARLNRSILTQGWGYFRRRLEDKALGRVFRVPAAYTSQQCSACGHVARESRESQAVFRCVACGFRCHADVNAARNIAAGQAVTARGDRISQSWSMNREPQLRPIASVA
jgi:transposase